MPTNTQQNLRSAAGKGVRHYGKYRATVSDNQDPKGIGRVRATVPEVLGSVVSGWALPVAPMAGNVSGFFSIPAIGTGIWIEFEAGDVSRPLWTGGWWSSDQVPKTETGTSVTPDTKIWQSDKGLLVSMDDSSETLTLSDSNGNNILTIKSQDGQITIQATSKVVVQAPSIELVDGAMHPVPFGDSLLQYLTQMVTTFNTHMHPGELCLAVLPVTPAPPVAPMMPPTPSLLSTIVMTG